jgi:hypothetical protein
MASTTFIDNQTVIYAAWLNDVNNVVYNGIFQSASITATSMICNGTASGAGFTSLINNAFSAPGPIGSVTPSTGAFTTLTATTALPVSSGGTGANTLTSNNVLLGNGTSALQVVAPGTSGNVLTSNGTTWTSAASQGVGSGQNWSLPSRSGNTSYTNSTGKPIQVAISTTINATLASPAVAIFVNGLQIMEISGSSVSAQYITSSFIVPNGQTYQCNLNNASITRWAELS